MYSEVIPTFLQLVALLREVKYLEQMGESSRTLPESAAAVFEKNETYRMFLQVIECVCVEVDIMVLCTQLHLLLLTLHSHISHSHCLS